MLYNEIKNEEGVNAMTNENYISYLVGTANGYPSKTQRYLKMLFSTAGIAVPDDQISIPFDVDTTVNIKDIVHCLLRETTMKLWVRDVFP